MTNKNSNSLRCRQCGVVNWATDENCRRCHQLLNGTSPANAGESSTKSYIYLSIFIAALAIPFLIGRANPATGDDLGLFFVLAALGVMIVCNLLLLFEMFRVSILWGVAGFFLSPLSTLLFIAKYWNQSKGKVFTSLAAMVYCIIMIAGVGQMNKPKVVQNTAAPQNSSSLKYLDQTPTPKPDFLQPRKDLLRKNPSDR
jgi:hypothetical protein